MPALLILAASAPTTIGMSAIVTLIVILALCGALLTAQAKLVNQGKVRVLINDDESKSLEVEAGGTLLSTLSSSGILLPSACGGGGTCGVCRCRVLEGGGDDLLPTEEGHISRKEAKNHWRLSCQVKVKQDMRIQVPAEVFSINKWECEVVSNHNVATFIKEFVVRLPPGENLDFHSGGYIQIEVPPYEIDYKNFAIEKEFQGDWDKFNVWDLKAVNKSTVIRAYSMANHPAEGDIVMLNIRIATPPPDRVNKCWMNVPPGIASSFIFNCKPGDKVTISGPYGEFFIQDTDREMLYIGGGAGMAPLRSHLFHLFHTLKTGRKVSYWYGARSLREVFYEEHFRDIESKFDNFKFHIALSDALPEDNWTGYKGFIHSVVLDNYLSKHPAPEDIEYYLCGPPMMLSACLKMFDDLGVEEEMVRFDDFG